MQKTIEKDIDKAYRESIKSNGNNKVTLRDPHNAPFQSITILNKICLKAEGEM